VAILGTRGYPSYYGGFETAVRRLAPYLADRNWDVTVFSRPGATVPDDPGRDERVTVRVTPGLETRSLSTLSYGLSGSLSLLPRRPDVALIMNTANGYFLPMLRARGIPTVINVDGMEWDRAKWGRFAKLVFRNGATLTGRYGTRLVYDSREIARRWQEEFGREGDFIPYGADVPPELPLEDGLTHRGYVLLVARFVPENTVPEFLDAVEELGARHDVVIVGSAGYGGELDERARTLAARHARVRWLGHVSDDDRLFSLWQHAGAYFHGHSVGGTNPALVQAMACGAPTIARDTPYNREVLEDAGEFVAPEAPAIVAAVEALLADPARQELVSAAVRRRRDEAYTWEGVCAAYEASLESVVAVRR
jgi:glycosyltransferase involved in cell wall biosynthesis